MTTVHEYDEARLVADRITRRLVCTCRRPEPQLLAEWQAVQCARCGRKVVS